MIKNYFKIAVRSLIKQKGYSFINIAGLATGMAVAILIGLWIWDELAYDKYHKNYDHIAQVWQHSVFNGVTESINANPFVMAEEIRNNFGIDFKYVLEASWNETHTLTFRDRKFNKAGSYFEPEVTEMFTLKMLRGSREGLKEPIFYFIICIHRKAFFLVMLIP